MSLNHIIVLRISTREESTNKKKQTKNYNLELYT